MTCDASTLAALDALLAAIRGYDDPRRASTEWKQAYKLLQKTDLPGSRVTHIVGMRDVPSLVELIETLRAPAEAAGAVDAPDPEVCSRALRAFRKRMALTKLDDESRISSHSPLSKGADARGSAIIPPMEWPDAIWQELVRQGKLRYVGHGFYELP